MKETIVDGLHIHTYTYMKQLAIALSEAERRLWEWGIGGWSVSLTNVQCKSIGNWHNESTLGHCTEGSIQ
jgi:hypothetical protein